MDLNLSFLQNYTRPTEFVSKDFLAIEKPDYYSQIIGNPPFSKNQDIDHVYKMYECLAEGGRIASIMSNHWRNTSRKKETEFQQFIERCGATIEEIPAGAFKESGTTISACIVVIDKKSDIEPPVSKKATTKQSKIDSLPTSPKTKIPPKFEDSLKEFEDSFNKFTYKFRSSEIFIDFIDYSLLVAKWWESNKDFSYFEKKYKDLFPNFLTMFELMANASDNCGEGFRDALGDLFMELVSHGQNGQYFTPDHICDLMSMISCPDLKDGQNVLDSACGSGRMLLAAAKRNRKANFFGNDIDITCCKMAVLNMILNTMTGEIAQMNALTMEYHKSWFVYSVNYGGFYRPMYKVIENKDESPFYKMHINSFKMNSKVDSSEQKVESSETLTLNLDTSEQKVDSSIPEPTLIQRKQKSKQNITQLQLELF